MAHIPPRHLPFLPVPRPVPERALQIVKSFIAAGLLAGTAPAPPAAPASVAPVVEAERAFARMAQEKGAGEAFRTFVAEEGRMFLPGPTRAKPILAGGKAHFGPLRWWPVYAGLAASGDLGFTTGPAVSGEGAAMKHAIYFTVWKRQLDGQWRWLLDKGSTQRVQPAQGPATPVVALGKAAKGLGAGAWSDVAAAETVLAKALAQDAHAALSAALAPDGRLLRDGPPPAVGRAAVRSALASQAGRVTVATLGGEASAAGDLAYTYGTAAWSDSTGERHGYYARIWQRRAGGWRLVVDQMSAPPATTPEGG